MGRCALLVALLAACGRIDFDVAHDAAQTPIANCVVGPNLQVSNAGGASRGPALAGNGAGFDSGAPLTDELQPDPGQYGQVAVARWSGAELGMIWADFRNGILEPYFARLDATGTKLGDDQRVSTGGLDIELDGHDLAWTGARFAIAWGDKRSGDPELYVALADCTP
jgi:hypothetical protein